MAWAPVTSGRLFVRELQVLRATGREPTGHDAGAPLMVGGFVYPDSLVAELKAVDVLSDGRAGLDGVLHEPDATSPIVDQPAVLLFNTGAEHHLGPGRTWVMTAREWAGEGRTVLRLDLSGIAESPARPGQPEQQTYGPHVGDDVIDAVQWRSPDA